MAAIPSIIPRPSGYQLKPQVASVATEMERGPNRQRNITSAPPSQIPVQWNMTQAQFQVFEAFHTNELVYGNAWFQIDLYNGMGYTNYDARMIKGEFIAKYNGFDDWVVTAVLEILARPVLTQGSY